MKTGLKILAAYILLVVSLQSYAGAGWSGEATITGIYSLNETTALFKLSSFNNPNNCNVDSAGDIQVNPSTQKTWFTLLLSAYMANKPVNIYVSSTCLTTHWVGPSYSGVSHMRLQ